MGNSGEAVNDEGSGWFEVKKKNRSSSKFSLQSWVGEFYGKNASNHSSSQTSSSENSGNSCGKRRSQLPKVRGNYAGHCRGSDANSIPVPNENKMGVPPYLDTGVIRQDTRCPKSPPFITNSDGGTRDVEKIPAKDNSDVVHKIKWGDLEDEALALPHANLVGTRIKFGAIGDDNLVASSEHGIGHKFASRANSQENILVAESVDARIVSHQMFSVTAKDQLREDNCKEVNIISSENAEEPILNEKKVDLDNNVSHCKDIHTKHIEAVVDDRLSALILAGEEAGVVGKLQAPIILSEVGHPEIAEVSGKIGGSSEVHIAEDKGLVPPESDPEISGVSTITASVEDHGDRQCGIIHDMSNSQNMSALGDDTGESKERFRQRLWCFLFENLNRDVDELYLLCELECDLEQMKEAILVLEEAASDFRDLSTRVEDFEKIRRSSSQLIDGVPVTLKSDHRRPHALSWEVRRMTTSAHKAEILSSSLEAFKKIQQERASLCAANDAKLLGTQYLNLRSGDKLNKSSAINDGKGNAKDSIKKSRKQSGGSDLAEADLNGGKWSSESSSKTNLVQTERAPQNSSSSVVNASRLPPRDNSAAGKTKSKQSGSEAERLLPKKEKLLIDGVVEKFPRLMDQSKRQIPLVEKDKEKRNSAPWKSMAAWKEKRNWEDVLSSPFRVSSRVSHSPGMRRKSADRARMLHDKLMSPEKKKKTALDLKREAEEKHARALRIKSELDNERAQKLHRNSEKVYRASEFHAVRNMKLREGIYARHQRSESRHEAFLAQVVKRAGDESSKVNEVRFITSLNEENKKLSLRQKLHDSELRRAEKLQVIRTKQKEDMAREEAVLERRKLIEAEKLQRLAETQRRKEEAQVRREEERKASSAAREARAMEQLRRKEERAKAQQEEAELLAQKLAERLSESEQRRKFYLEQIRERASMDFRDQSSPLLRRNLNKEGQGRSSINSGDDYQGSSYSGLGGSTLVASNVTAQHSMKRRIKRIRQRLMALKYEFPEPPVGAENASIGYRTALGTARAKIGRWLQELQRLRQARKEGAASIGLIIAEMIKYLEGKEPELQASRQTGLLDFIASALPASHTSKPEACQVTIHLLKLLRVVLSVPANRSYFLAQNLLPPIIPMLSAALESYIKIAVSLNLSGNGNGNSLSSKTSAENFESISEVLDGYLWTVTTIVSHISSDEQQLQMRDGLLELLIAYQVIHRLRDLFALYDRPQVEGSPFSSSILLSINLLVVLTSRSETNCSIDWKYVPIETVVGNGSEEAKFAEVDSTEDLPLTQSLGNSRPPLSVQIGGTVVHLPDVPEDGPLDESCMINKSTEAVSTGKDSEKEQYNSLIEARNDNTIKTDVPGETQKIPSDDTMEPFASQKDEKHLVDNGAVQKNEIIVSLEQPVAFLLTAVSETGLVSLPSLLTSVLLQANNRLSSERTSDVLPSNFEDVATGVLKVLNNLALLDLKFMQRTLARPDLKMEFFHLMSFLLSHCTTKWKVANDQVGFLLLESLLLLGHFALFHLGNQAVLRWGKSPTIIHKVCDLPFVFFSDPELMPILAGTLVAACYGCEQNKGVVQQEISTDMLLSLLRSCRNILPAVRSNSNLDTFPADDAPLRSGRNNTKSTRVSLAKGGGSGNSMRIGKMKSHRESKVTKSYEETALKHDLPVSETSSMMLHCRFPINFIDRAEDFFSSGTPGIGEV